MKNLLLLPPLVLGLALAACSSDSNSAPVDDDNTSDTEVDSAEQDVSEDAELDTPTEDVPDEDVVADTAEDTVDDVADADEDTPDDDVAVDVADDSVDDDVVEDVVTDVAEDTDVADADDDAGDVTSDADVSTDTDDPDTTVAACTESDQAMLNRCSGEISADCVLSCEGDPECARTCVADAFSLTDDCEGCFADHAVCTATECVEECASSVDECRACAQTQCEADLFACAGVDDASELASCPECRIDCDCSQGLMCVSGECIAGIVPAYCCDNPGCPDGANCSDVSGDSGICVAPTDCEVRGGICTIQFTECDDGYARDTSVSCGLTRSLECCLPD